MVKDSFLKKDMYIPFYIFRDYLLLQIEARVWFSFGLTCMCIVSAY